MALKSLRSHLESEIGFFFDATAERGGIAVLKTVGSGDGMDQSVAVAEYAATSSGKMPIGVLMNDVVNIDLTRQKLNPYKDEVQINTKVCLWSKGDVETNWLLPGITVSMGDRAYLGPSGYITNADLGANATPIVGYFKSSKDEDGFAKVAVNLPMARS